jgi:hypothetical protein
MYYRSTDVIYDIIHVLIWYMISYHIYILSVRTPNIICDWDNGNHIIPQYYAWYHTHIVCVCVYEAFIYSSYRGMWLCMTSYITYDIITYNVWNKYWYDILHHSLHWAGPVQNSKIHDVTFDIIPDILIRHHINNDIIFDHDINILSKVTI